MPAVHKNASRCHTKYEEWTVCCVAGADERPVYTIKANKNNLFIEWILRALQHKCIYFFCLSISLFFSRICVWVCVVHRECCCRRWHNANFISLSKKKQNIARVMPLWLFFYFFFACCRCCFSLFSFAPATVVCSPCCRYGNVCWTVKLCLFYFYHSE